MAEIERKESEMKSKLEKRSSREDYPPSDNLARENALLKRQIGKLEESLKIAEDHQSPDYHKFKKKIKELQNLNQELEEQLEMANKNDSDSQIKRLRNMVKQLRQENEDLKFDLNKAEDKQTPEYQKWKNKVNLKNKN